MVNFFRAFMTALVLLIYGIVALASPTQTRLDEAITDGKPIVIQVSVALADNRYQWIAPVPTAIGNGQEPRTNLYWGARYGVKTYLTGIGGWIQIAVFKPRDKRILQRLVLKHEFTRNGRGVTVYLVADAWDGQYIRDTIRQFFRYSAGHDGFDLSLDGARLNAGGKAQLIVYIGHNALMDYAGIANLLLSNTAAASPNPVKDGIVLACKSQAYFQSRLQTVGTHPLLLTTGLMAPEAYSLHAAVEQWIGGADDNQVRKAAAASYDHYQKTGRKAAERLFAVR